MNALSGLETLKTNWLARAILTASAVGVFYASTIRTGHNWGDDFAGYILQAQAVGTHSFLEQPADRIGQHGHFTQAVGHACNPFLVQLEAIQHGRGEEAT